MPDPQTITAGSLQHRVSVHALKTNLVPNAGGHIDETVDSNWRQLFKRWARILPRNSREFFRGQEIAEDITHEIRMRSDSQSGLITTAMKIKYGNRTFNISGPPRNIDEDGIQISFPATEIK